MFWVLTYKTKNMEDLEKMLNDFLNDPDNADRLKLRQEVRRALDDRGGFNLCGLRKVNQTRQSVYTWAMLHEGSMALY